MKEELSKSTTNTCTLRSRGANKGTLVSADAASYGLGAVLMQETESRWRPVAYMYVSHSMSDTEQRYAQIEKEALAITWAGEKFSNYILSKTITIETDHKPLVLLLGNKQLDKLPPQVLQFRLHMDSFTYTVTILHVPGRDISTTDTLSHAPLPSTAQVDNLEELAELLLETNVVQLPASKGSARDIAHSSEGSIRSLTTVTQRLSPVAVAPV